jgi:hypothetical protein
MKTASVQHLLTPGIATFPFVISTEAKRSGEISVLTPLPGNVFRQLVAQRFSSGALLAFAKPAIILGHRFLVPRWNRRLLRRSHLTGSLPI